MEDLKKQWDQKAPLNKEKRVRELNWMIKGGKVGTVSTGSNKTAGKIEFEIQSAENHWVNTEDKNHRSKCERQIFADLESREAK